MHNHNVEYGAALRQIASSIRWVILLTCLLFTQLPAQEDSLDAYFNQLKDTYAFATQDAKFPSCVIVILELEQRGHAAA